MARPTKYTPALLKRAESYIDKYEDEGDVIPSHVGLANYLNLSTVCMYDWAKQEDKEEFSYILQEVLQKQHQTLVNKGLTGVFNSNITKLVLGKHGYHDKQDTTVKGTVGLTDLSEDELDRRLQHLESQHEQSTKD